MKKRTKKMELTSDGFKRSTLNMAEEYGRQLVKSMPRRMARYAGRTAKMSGLDEAIVLERVKLGVADAMPCLEWIETLKDAACAVSNLADDSAGRCD